MAYGQSAGCLIFSTEHNPLLKEKHVRANQSPLSSRPPHESSSPQSHRRSAFPAWSRFFAATPSLWDGLNIVTHCGSEARTGYLLSMTVFSLNQRMSKAGSQNSIHEYNLHSIPVGCRPEHAHPLLRNDELLAELLAKA